VKLAGLPQKVTVAEFSPRDGLQSLERFIPTEAKVWLIDNIIDAGFTRTEVTSFANPKYLPQFRDAEEVMRRIKRKGGITYIFLATNEAAMDRLVKSLDEGYGDGLDSIMVDLVVSTSESHCRRNLGRSQEEVWARMPRLIRRAQEAGLRVVGDVSTAFGCPIEGPVPLERAVEFAGRYLDLGVDEVKFGDTTGEGNPVAASRLFATVRDRYPGATFVAHFHESRGSALANNLAALLEGCTHFDSSLGGIGGQPPSIVDGIPVRGTGPKYTPSDLTGNTSTEDLACMFQEMGLETGLNLERVIDLGRMLEKVVGRQLYSKTARTGPVPKGPTGR
jgi:hydroxymethylglutaryl-CoA lyase